MTQTSLAHVLGVRREAEAERAIADLSAKGVWRAPIVTELAPLEKFYPAEACHQDYFEQNPRQR